MRLGIKIGPKNWQDKLDSGVDIRGVEVFYDRSRSGAYPPMFAALQERGIESGLHLSTSLPGGIAPNLATADGDVRRQSMDLLLETVDLAAANGVRFVVYHPGSFRVQAIQEGQVVTIGADTPAAVGRELLLQGADRLTAHGRARGVGMWAENLPAYEFAAYDPLDREHVVDTQFVSCQILSELAEAGTGLCLDVGHLYAEAHAQGLKGQAAWERVLETSRQLEPHARHLHLSTIAPPYNGTDSHNGFLASDYALGAVPSPAHTRSWLSLFADRDLWVIPEPDGGPDVHLANYRRLAAWMAQL